jgi:hypothetical protein
MLRLHFSIHGLFFLLKNIFNHFNTNYMNTSAVKRISVFLIGLLTAQASVSQNVAINASGTAANASAILDLDGVSGFAGPNGYKGFLVPRMTSAQRTGIVTLPAAAQGLLVYQTDGVQGFYYNTSTTTTPSWVYMVPSTSGAWNVLGNAGITQPASPAIYGTSVFGAAENWMGTSDARDVVFGTTNIERMRLFSSGQLSIGSSLVGAKLDVHQVTATAAGRFTTYGNTNDIELRRAQGTQAAPAATTVAGTVLGRIFGQGYNGAGYTSAASISMETDATGGTATDMPGRIVFNTALDGTGTPLVERMRITNAGLVGIGTTPLTSLDVNGAFSERFSTAAAAAAVVIPANVSLFRLSLTAGATANALTSTSPQDGQYLTIINEDDNTCTFGGFTIPAIAGSVAGVGYFVYSGTGAVWRQISSAPASGGGSGWGLTGNAGTDGGTTNFIGTTDARALSFRVGGVGTTFRSGLIDHQAGGSTFFGYQAGKTVASGGNLSCTGMGYQALTVVTGTHNSAFGRMTLAANTSGTANTAIGSLSMQQNVNGAQNTAVGVNSLNGTTSGTGNTSVGYQSMYFNTTGTYNTAVGYLAYNFGNSFTNSMVLGADATGVNNVSANNQVFVGDQAITSIKGQVSFTTYSDGRVKKNVQENVPGLTFINELRPVTYNYDHDKQVELSGGKKNPDIQGQYEIEQIKFSGFIAQEVEGAANRTGYDFSGVDKPVNGKGLYGLRYSEFVVPLVKAVQELSSENNALKEKVETISENNKAMRAELDKIKSMLEARNN